MNRLIYYLRTTLPKHRGRWYPLPAVLLLALAAELRAADMFWNNASGDDSFHTADNWAGGIPIFNPPPPSSNDVAHFGRSDSRSPLQFVYTVGFNAEVTNEAFVVEDDSVTFDLNGNVYITTSTNPIRIGTSSSFSAGLTIRDGNVAANADSVMTVGAGGPGSFTVSTGALLAGSLMDIHVGSTGSGALTVNGGGDVIADGVFIGTSNGTGSATITGGGSVLVASALSVGQNRTGTLNVTVGGKVESTSGVIGENANTTGTANINGTGSKWDISGGLTVGFRGIGELNITGGGLVENTEAIIGSVDGSEGTVTVSGAGSQWTNLGNLYIGGEEDGTLHIAGGGTVTNNNAVIAATPASTGTVIVSSAVPGSSSTWNVNGTLGIGGDPNANGIGTLRIQPGGTVNTTQGIGVVGGGNLLSLEGGTLSTASIGFQGSAKAATHFDWTSGTLHVGVFSGNLLNQGGVLARGNVSGTTIITEDYNQLAGATLQLGIAGTTVPLFDRVSCQGNVFLNGNLELALLDGFVPSVADTFVVLDAVNIFGGFANVANGQRLSTSDGLGSFIVNYGMGSAFLSSHIVLSDFLVDLLDGDLNNDDFVGQDDLNILLGHWGQNVTAGNRLMGDSSGDGFVGQSDLNDVLGGWGLGTPPGLAATNAVPEPQTLLHLAIAMALIPFCRSKRQRKFSTKVWPVQLHPRLT